MATLLTLAFQNKIIHSLQNFSELPCVIIKIFCRYFDILYYST